MNPVKEIAQRSAILDELIIAAGEEYTLEVLKKGINYKHLKIASVVKEKFGVPMKFVIDRMLNEHGRVFATLSDQEISLNKNLNYLALLITLYYDKKMIGAEYVRLLKILCTHE